MSNTDGGSDRDDSGVHHRKSGAVENAVDAFYLTEWFSRVLSDEGQDKFGRAFRVEVEVKITDLDVGDGDE